ncbi:MAG TPA: SRPBCC family protein [Pyrinomonadaceae bacterium]|nr:SRPBCC family protein [Pyrinomonadaceae bacterium]
MASREESLTRVGEQNKTMRRTSQNVNDYERYASVIGGGALALYGLSRASLGGIALALIGGGLVYRGATGHCNVYEAFGVNTATGDREGGVSVPKDRAIRVSQSVTINRSPEELYQFWHNFENLPHFMNHLEAVQTTGDKRSHWVAKAPAGTTVEWDAEIINDKPNELIAWRSLAGADVDNSGSVRFERGPEGRGTQVRVEIQYSPPGGVIGATIAKLFGEEPNQQVQEDLRRFKQVMEAGEIPTTEGQSSGRASSAGSGR